MEKIEILKKQLKKEGLRLHVQKIFSDKGEFYILTGRDIEKMKDWENVRIVSEIQAVLEVEDEK
jgi:hypothetical protein